MRILSGIQATGAPHLGNYIGALRHYVSNQDLGDGLYFIADLHALTVLPDPAELRDNTVKTAAMLLACGVDPQRATLFVQSDIAAVHTEMQWLLTCVANVGELTRMTQFKDKGSGAGDGTGAGILMYPVLMAADVLLYDADRVPVGADQKQHLELTRNLAQRVNNRYGAAAGAPDGKLLVVPEPLIADIGARVLDLQDPSRKMSKSSDGDKGTVWVFDDPARIVKKCKSAVTDSETEVRYDPAAKPGVSNLLELLHIASGREIAELEREFAHGGYGTFKQAVGDALVELLTPIQARFHDYLSDRGELERILGAGADRARGIAQETLDRMRRAVGVAR